MSDIIYRYSHYSYPFLKLPATQLGGSDGAFQYSAINNMSTTQPTMGMPFAPINSGISSNNSRIASTAPVTSTVALTTAQERRIRTVEWLRAALASRTGFVQFQRGRNQQQHNPTVAKSWAFAVEFLEQYVTQVIIVSVSLS